MMISPGDVGDLVTWSNLWSKPMKITMNLGRLRSQESQLTTTGFKHKEHERADYSVSLHSISQSMTALPPNLLSMTEHCSSKWFVRTWEYLRPRLTRTGVMSNQSFAGFANRRCPFKPIPWLNLCIWTLLRLWKSGWYSLLKGDTTEPCWSRICRLLKRQQILTTFASSIDYGVGPFMDLGCAKWI